MIYDSIHDIPNGIHVEIKGVSLIINDVHTGDVINISGTATHLYHAGRRKFVRVVPLVKGEYDFIWLADTNSIIASDFFSRVEVAIAKEKSVLLR